MRSQTKPGLDEKTDQGSNCSAHAPLAESIKRHGWPLGFESYVNNLPELQAQAIGWEFWPRHTGWKVFLNPDRQADALIIDSTYGSAVVALAGDYTRVRALYSDAELMKTVQARVQWLGIENVIFQLVPDFLSARFPELSLDTIVVYGLPLRTLPEEFLQQCASWLSSTGAMYIAFRNESGKVPFRRAARKFKEGIALLKFLRVLHSCVPQSVTYRYHSDLLECSEITPLNGEHRSFKDWLKSFASAWIAPAFGIAAYKSEQPRLVLTAVLDEIRRDCPGGLTKSFRPVVRRHFFSNPTGFTFVVADEASQNQEMVVKIPFGESALTRCSRNHAVLASLSRLPTEISSCAPKLILAGTVKGHHFFAESAIQGQPITEKLLRRPAEPSHVLSEVASWITQLHLATASYRVLDEHLVGDWIVSPLRKAFSVLMRAPFGPEFFILKEFLERFFLGRKIPTVLSHGDFSVDNVLVDHRTSRVRAVFDWDLALDVGLPLLDIVYLLLSAEILRTGGTEAEVFGRKLFPLRLKPLEKRVLEHYQRALQIPQDMIFPFTLLTWVYHLAFRAEYPENYVLNYLRRGLSDPAMKVAVEIIGQRGI